ncbi:hypothetical protein H8A97_20940 [Bradyrhizobium sp. Arg62]|uniref:hypothetical protein n=1 Tax=Bradyrhizobium brasilense TaxID=1419277 RepID=UPI001E546171|nr:hypothetical protein [Bradyrhizobium brasilense]MCC8947506.1 hypothetical protein [Bradyrhizobium brasilense]
MSQLFKRSSRGAPDDIPTESCIFCDSPLNSAKIKPRSQLAHKSVECESVAADQHVFGAVLLKLLDQQKDVVPGGLARVAVLRFKAAFFATRKREIKKP